MDRRYLLVVLILLSACDWRWSAAPYRGEAVSRPVVTEVAGQQVPVVAMVVRSVPQQPLDWFSMASHPPRLAVAALVRVGERVRGLVAKSPGSIRQLRLNGQDLKMTNEETVGAWQWLDLDEDSRLLAEPVAVEAGDGTPHWVARPVPNSESPSFAVLPVTAGVFVCAPLCQAGDLIFDRQARLVGAVTGDDLHLQPLPLRMANTVATPNADNKTTTTTD